MSFIKRSQDSTTNNFHNLQHLNDSEENDVQEEEYQWIKKRNAKLLKDQQQQNKSKVQEEDDKKNSIDKENIFSAGSKEENDPQEVLTTPQKEKKEEKKSTRILTPIQSNSNRILVQRNNGKSAFKSPSKNSESSFPSDDFVKLLSPVIERASSKLSLHSYSDSKETTPVRDKQEEKSIPEELSQTFKLGGRKESEAEETKDEDLQEQEEEEQSPAIDVESKYDLEDSAVEQLFSKVRHNRMKQVATILEEGFDVHSKDRYGNNLLHICAQNNLSTMASLCLTHGADINSMNKKGLTPLDYCDMYHFTKLAEWFVMMGGENSSYGLDGKK